MELSDGLKNCLLLAMEDDDLDFEGSVDAGLRMFSDLIGGPIEIEDEEEGEELIMSCFKFVFNVTIGRMEDAGLIEMKGVSEDGDTMWGLTEGFDVESFLNERNK